MIHVGVVRLKKNRAQCEVVHNANPFTSHAACRAIWRTKGPTEHTRQPKPEMPFPGDEAARKTWYSGTYTISGNDTPEAWFTALSEYIHGEPLILKSSLATERGTRNRLLHMQHVFQALMDPNKTKACIEWFKAQCGVVRGDGAKFQIKALVGTQTASKMIGVPPSARPDSARPPCYLSFRTTGTTTIRHKRANPNP